MTKYFSQSMLVTSNQFPIRAQGPFQCNDAILPSSLWYRSKLPSIPTPYVALPQKHIVLFWTCGITTLFTSSSDKSFSLSPFSYGCPLFPNSVSTVQSQDAKDVRYQTMTVFLIVMSPCLRLFCKSIERCCVTCRSIFQTTVVMERM